MTITNLHALEHTTFAGINSPLEQFEVTSLLSLNTPLLGYLNITITNLALYSIIVLFSPFWDFDILISILFINMDFVVSN